MTRATARSSNTPAIATACVLEQLAVGDNFIPDVGSSAATTCGSRLASSDSARGREASRDRAALLVDRRGNVHRERHGRVETRDWGDEFAIEFQNSDRFSVGYGSTYEFLPQPLRIVGPHRCRSAGYDYASGTSAFNFGRQRRMSGNVSLEKGTFYSGHKTTSR